jgi:hypothetical protein
LQLFYSFEISNIQKWRILWSYRWWFNFIIYIFLFHSFLLYFLIELFE